MINGDGGDAISLKHGSTKLEAAIAIDGTVPNPEKHHEPRV